MWTLIGLALSLLVAAAAWLQAARARTSAGARDGGPYAMTARSHGRYAVASLAFALFFALAYLLHQAAAALGALAVYALIAIVYGASFLQGYADDE